MIFFNNKKTTGIGGMQPNTVVLGFPGDKQIDNISQNNVYYDNPQTSKEGMWTKLATNIVDSEDPKESVKLDLDKFSQIGEKKPISPNEYFKILSDIIKCKKNIVIARQ